MAVNQSSEALRRPLNLLRLGFFVVTLAAFVLGYLGLAALDPKNTAWGHQPLDLVYYDLQLFVLGPDPLQSTAGPIPVALQWARFLAPAVTLYALIETARLLFSVELSRRRARRARGHAIVCGDTVFADTLSRRLQAEGTEVVDIRMRGDDFVTAGEPLRIIGDARDPEVLRAAGVERARAVYACTGAGAENATIALATARLRRTGAEPVSVYSHIPDPELCAALQAAFLTRSRLGLVHLDFFNVDQIAARRLFAADPLLPIEQRPPRILVADAGEFGAAVVVAAARSWRVGPACADPVPITLVGAQAGVALAALSERYPFLAGVCRFTSRDSDLLPLLVRGELEPPPDRLFVCGADEEHALKTAMVAERLWRGQVRSIVVRLEGLATYLDEDGVLPPGRSFDAGSSPIRAFGVTSSACDPELIRDDLMEQLAHVIHERYRQGRRLRGEWSPEDPSLEPWDRLSPALRQANRAQAEDIGRKLAEVNCTIAPRIGVDDEAVLSGDDLARLAQYEHERWRAEYETAGWRYAPHRSEERKLHPGLRPWHSLPPAFQHRNHHAVQELADILADAGFRIVRT